MQATAEVEGNALRVHDAQNLVKRDLEPLQGEVDKSLRGNAADLELGNTEDLFYRPPDVNGSQSMSTQALLQSSEDLLRESQA